MLWKPEKVKCVRQRKDETRRGRAYLFKLSNEILALVVCNFPERDPGGRFVGTPDRLLPLEEILRVSGYDTAVENKLGCHVEYHL